MEHRPTSLDGRGRDGSTYETKDDLSKVGETAYSELDREVSRGRLLRELWVHSPLYGSSRFDHAIPAIKSDRLEIHHF